MKFNENNNNLHATRDFKAVTEMRIAAAYTVTRMCVCEN